MLHSQPRDGADCWIKYDLTRTKTAGYDLFPNVLPVYNVAKWLELLKEIAPSVTRAAVSRDPTIAAGMGQFAAIQAVGPIGMELSVIVCTMPERSSATSPNLREARTAGWL
jgi:hypothetical protein